VTGRPPASVKSSERTLQVLQTLGECRTPITVAELHRLTGYPRSSLHQLVHTMINSGWLDQTEDGKVGIGARALLVGTAYLDADPLLPHAMRTLEELRSQTGYTTHVARQSGASVIYLASREAVDAHRAVSRIGRELPVHATALGKALLAELTDAEVRAVLHRKRVALTEHTVTDAAELIAQLAEVRSRGYSVEREENTPGLSCVAAPIGYRIPATEAISVSMPARRAGAREVTRVARLLVGQVAELTQTLRGHGIR